MRPLLHLLENADPCAAVLLVALLAYVGGRMVAEHPSLRQWGMRLAAVVFIAYCTERCVHATSPDANELFRIVLRGLFAGGLALGVAWLVLPLLAFVFHVTIVAPWATACRWAAAARQSASQRRTRREEKARRRRAEEEYARTAPQRERARLEAEARAKTEADAQRRREDARAACELLYSLHAPEIGERFSKQLFDDFVARHLGDGRPHEDVERRAEQLQAILHQHLEKIEPSKKKQTVESLATWYQQMKQQIDAQPVEARYKNAQLAQLNVRYATLVQELMQEMEP